jgi:hypothetical protein
MLGTSVLEPVGLALALVVAVAFGLQDALITGRGRDRGEDGDPLLASGAWEFADPVVHGAEQSEPEYRP